MRTWILCVIICFMLLISGCQGKKVETTPDSIPSKVPQLNITPDATMYKALKVIRKFGRKVKDYMKFSRFQKLKKRDDTLNPDIFYDQYTLDLNEQNNWITIIYGTAVRSKAKDQRIANFMRDFPENAVDVKLKTPSGKIYFLSDSNADGVLDFVNSLKKKSSGQSFDLALLKRMQEKYHWILDLVKKNYKSSL